MTTNIFEEAARKKLRFVTNKGALATEDLFTLELTQLNELAVELHHSLQNTSVSFIDKPTTKNQLVALRFAIVKYVIDKRLEEQEQAKNAAIKKAEVENLMRVISDKRNDQLQNTSLEELEARLKALTQ